MFFRRKAVKQVTFEDRLQKAQQAGFSVEPLPGGRRRQVRISRNCVAAILEDEGKETPRMVVRAGPMLGNAIASLVDGGFQKFFQTPSGKRKPALAEDLKAIHEFEEDLREALGLIGLYNESLGTVSTLYLYDRVEDRDRGTPKRAWE
jgi:hypothetical protein